MGVVRDVLVDLVGDGEPVVGPAQFRDGFQVLLVQHLAGRVLGVFTTTAALTAGSDRAARSSSRSSRQVPARQPSRQGHEATYEPEDRPLRAPVGK